MAVYAFIATPVQLWHHHSYKVNTESVKLAKEKTESNVFKSAQQSADANCQICSHHYSVYNDVANIVFDVPTLIFPSGKEYYIYSIPSALILSCSNKGPPAA